VTLWLSGTTAASPVGALSGYVVEGSDSRCALWCSFAYNRFSDVHTGHAVALIDKTHEWNAAVRAPADLGFV